MLAEQFGELVDHDEQRRQWCQVGTRRAGPAVVADAGQVPGRPHQPLAPGQLAGEGVVHPGDQMCLLRQIGDDRRDVVHLFKTEKCCAAFEVDEDQVQLVGRVRADQPQRQRPQ